jgi:hypothetical protein
MFVIQETPINLLIRLLPEIIIPTPSMSVKEAARLADRVGCYIFVTFAFHNEHPPRMHS